MFSKLPGKVFGKVSRNGPLQCDLRNGPRKGPRMYRHYDTHLQLQKSEQATFWREFVLLQTSGVVFTLDVPLHTANTRQLVVAYLVLSIALVATSM
jgi:hypothetical protein